MFEQYTVVDVLTTFQNKLERDYWNQNTKYGF